MLKFLRQILPISKTNRISKNQKKIQMSFLQHKNTIRFGKTYSKDKNESKYSDDLFVEKNHQFRQEQNSQYFGNRASNRSSPPKEQQNHSFPISSNNMIRGRTNTGFLNQMQLQSNNSKQTKMPMLNGQKNMLTSGDQNCFMSNPNQSFRPSQNPQSFSVQSLRPAQNIIQKNNCQFSNQTNFQNASINCQNNGQQMSSSFSEQTNQQITHQNNSNNSNVQTLPCQNHQNLPNFSKQVNSQQVHIQSKNNQYRNSEPLPSSQSLYDFYQEHLKLKELYGRFMEFKEQSKNKVQEEKVKISYYCDFGPIPSGIRLEKQYDQNQDKPRAIVIVKNQPKNKICQLHLRKPCSFQGNRINLKQQEQDVFQDLQNQSTGMQEISKFPKIVQFLYTAKIVIEGSKQTEKQSKIYKGKILLFEKPSLKMKIEGILKQLQQNHQLTFKEPKVTELAFDIESGQISYLDRTWDMVSKFFKTKQKPRIEKSQIRFDFLVEDRKINLPQGYFLAKHLEFIDSSIDLNELEIGNKYGKIKWRCPKQISRVNIQEIDFREGLIIQQASVSIDKKQLEIGDLVVIFYEIPKVLQKYLEKPSEKNLDKIEKKLTASVEKEGYTFIKFHRNQLSWEIEMHFDTN